MWKSKKRLLICILLVLIPFIVMTLQQGRSGSVAGRSFIAWPFDTVNNLIATATRTFWQWRSALDENPRLRLEISRLLIEQERQQEILNENRRLKQLLDMKKSSHERYIFANLVGRGYDRLVTSAIIDRGERDGVHKDMVVITPRGLVGKVLSVRNDYADILLMRDPMFSVAVRLQQGRQEGVVSGIGRKMLVLKYIPPEEPVAIGEVVVTSGLDGIFPEGVPVGTVASIDREGGGFFQYIEVLPFQDDAKIEEVALIDRHH
jgi:rod shape-determining protein MreC